jgi:acyl carrier protein
MTKTATTTEILAKLQKAYDIVNGGHTRTLTRDDKLVDDLELDSLDLVDMVSALDGAFPPDVVDDVVEQASGVETIGELVDCFASATTGTD